MRPALRTKNSGLSIIELIIVIFIVGLLIVALTMFVGTSFRVSRHQIEQTRITEDARLQLERMADTIRNASFIDCNGDGFTQGAAEHWLGGTWAQNNARENQIPVFINIDSDQEKELVYYYVDPIDPVKLQRKVIEAPAYDICRHAVVSSTTTILGTLRNSTQNQPMFTYFSDLHSDTGLALPLADQTQVIRVRISLLVDIGTAQTPDLISIFTDVTPREVSCPSGDCGVGQCIDPGEQFLAYLYQDDFADQAFTDCRAHCATDDLPNGQCCGFSTGFFWNGDPNGAASAFCQCKVATLPPNEDVETVPEGGYTDFARECFDGTTCGAGINGRPLCVPGCEGSGGKCTCDCSL